MQSPDARESLGAFFFARADRLPGCLSQRLVHDERVNEAKRGVAERRKAPGSLPTTSKPSDCQRCTARSFGDTTRLIRRSLTKGRDNDLGDRLRVGRLSWPDLHAGILILLIRVDYAYAIAGARAHECSSR